MTRYDVGGRIVDERDLPRYLDDSAFAELTDWFEEEFNEENLAADVLYQIGGREEYGRYKRAWIAEKIAYNPRFLSDLGIVPASVSVRAGRSTGVKPSKVAKRSKGAGR